MRNRNRQINVRLSEPEFEKLKRSAEKSNLPVSVYLRSLIEGNSPKENPPLAYHQLMDRLERVGDQLKALFHLIFLSRKCDAVDAGILEKNMTEYRKLLLEVQAAVLLPEKAKK